jgi:hypothetical protein
VSKRAVAPAKRERSAYSMSIKNIQVKLTKFSFKSPVLWGNTFDSHLSGCKGRFRLFYFRSVSSVKSLWTGWPQNSVSLFGRGKRFFSSSEYLHPLWNSLNLLFSGCRRLFPWRVKLLRREGDHTTPSNAEVKNGWRYISKLSSVQVACK